MLNKNISLGRAQHGINDHNCAIGDMLTLLCTLLVNLSFLCKPKIHSQTDTSILLSNF